MRRSRAEQETIIRRAADEHEWDVFSEDPRVIRVLERRHGAGIPHGMGFRWLLAAPCVSFPKRRQLTERQRSEAAARLKAAREAKG